MAYGQGQEDSSIQALEVFGEKQGEVDVNQLMEMLKVLLPLIMQQGAVPGMAAPQGMIQPPARGMQGPPIPPTRPMQGPPAPLRHQLGAPAGLPMRPAPGGMPRRMQPMIPRAPQVRPQGGGGGNMLQMLRQMMGGGRR